MRIRHAFVLLSISGYWLAPEVGVIAAESVILLPSECALSTPASRQPLIVQEIEHGEVGRQRVAGDCVVIERPEVATVVDGTVTPVQDGQATITAKVDGRSATAKVVVEGMSTPFAWSFRNHVEPILAKQGCNSGACHGALAGKGGFRLSLRGYDPAADFFNIVKQDRGRRVELADPGQSLFVAKPSAQSHTKGACDLGPVHSNTAS